MCYLKVGGPGGSLLFFRDTRGIEDTSFWGDDGNYGPFLNPIDLKKIYLVHPVLLHKKYAAQESSSRAALLF